VTAVGTLHTLDPVRAPLPRTLDHTGVRLAGV
jgi:hypothetical protein